ncbi:hypothetical protein [Spirosoma linguale]|uniref:Uncharacterized protein n=1 Tax=Spirosoma linguale (strain ATCC 33905 / DSM 74 / LMG 10896 / Claus 1) TaxID=504472 RepID=D2QV12_SPILD|nr:hypothetical protein Slin_6688 [Spirosoma linguale DSM 74]
MRTKLPDELSPQEINRLLAVLTSYFDHDRISTNVVFKSGHRRLEQPQLRLYAHYPSIYCTKWRIFGGATVGRATSGRAASGCSMLGSNRQFMQQEISLNDLQANQSVNAFAVIDDYRILVDNAQAVVHFYKGRREWGRLVRSVPIEKWSGDWLIRTIGRFFRLDYQLADDKAIASIQRNGYLTVHTEHRIAGAVLYQRALKGEFWDYCVSYRGDVGFGVTVRTAIADLRAKLATRTNVEQAEIALKVGSASRFTQQQLEAFCEANGLMPGSHYTRQQLRQTVLRQRKLNCEQFRNQLSYFDIRINCK